VNTDKQEIKNYEILLFCASNLTRPVFCAEEPSHLRMRTPEPDEPSIPTPPTSLTPAGILPVPGLLDKKKDRRRCHLLLIVPLFCLINPALVS
jgi:hypothetical protein